MNHSSSTENSISPVLSITHTIYALSILAAILSVCLVYAAIFGPLIVLMCFVTFYFFKQNQTYFSIWTWSTIGTVFISVYVIALVLAYISFFLIFSFYRSPFIIFFSLIFIFWNLIYSHLSMIKSAIDTQFFIFRYQRSITILLSFILGIGLIYTYAHDDCGLTFTARSGSVHSVRLLLLMGADVDGKLCYETPLMSAAAYPSLVKLLLSHKANVNQKNNRNISALHKARGPQAVAVAQLLLQAGAHINQIDYRGQTPIYYAIRYKNKALIKFLIQHGADLTHQDHQGRVPAYQIEE